MSRSRRSTKFIVGALVIVATIVALILSSMQDSAVFVLTVGEFQAEATSMYGRGVRVQGVVEGNSVRWDSNSMALSFVLTDGGERMEVEYHGLKPDMLRDGADAIVEGEYTPCGIFEALMVRLKCPSKYEAAATATVTR